MTDREKVIKGIEHHMKGECRDCPYCKGWHACEAVSENGLFANALTLLKAQEPRVMTPEEIKESIKQDRRLAVYLQTKIGECKDCRAAGYTNFYGEDLSLRLCIQYVDISGWLEQITLYASAYNKEWRFWTSRPTDEQRETVKWDG